jgi:hypothetical protein
VVLVVALAETKAPLVLVRPHRVSAEAVVTATVLVAVVVLPRLAAMAEVSFRELAAMVFQTASLARQ